MDRTIEGVNGLFVLCVILGCSFTKTWYTFDSVKEKNNIYRVVEPLKCIHLVLNSHVSYNHRRIFKQTILGEIIKYKGGTFYRDIPTSFRLYSFFRFLY